VAACDQFSTQLFDSMLDPAEGRGNAALAHHRDLHAG
jgi:hypothetical protein